MNLGMNTNWIQIGSVFGLLSVAFGAFGAHALADRLSPRSLEIFHTATHYQMFHALAILVLGVLARATGTPYSITGWTWTVGIFIFSGSLYALALTEIRWLGAITPIGGVLFLIGWAALAFQSGGAKT